MFFAEDKERRPSPPVRSPAPSSSTVSTVPLIERVVNPWTPTPLHLYCDKSVCQFFPQLHKLRSFNLSRQIVGLLR